MTDAEARARSEQPPARASARAPAPAPAGADPLVGAEINGKYRIAAVVATGGMGRIYRAEQLPLGRTVAVKVLLPDLSCADPLLATRATPAFRGRFLREASALAKLQNAHVVTVFDYGRIDAPASEHERYFMAMEFLEGETLQDRIDRRGALPFADVTRFLRHLALGLRAAHARGIVHRDLKPSNLMIVAGPDGEEAVKLLDFGVTKLLLDDDQESTEEGVVIGSPRFLAPEQLGGTVDARADIYSLGIIAYAMVTGEPPFDGENALDTMMAHLNRPLPSIAAKRPDVPPALERFIRRCAEKEPSARYQTIDEVLDALRTDAPRAPPRRALFAAGVVVAALAAAGALWHAHGRSEARSEAPRATAVSAPPAVAADAPLESPRGHALAVTSTPPDAEVLGDGRLLGRTPLTYTIDPNRRTMRIEVRRDGYEAYARDVDTSHDVEIVAQLTPVAAKATSAQTAEHVASAARPRSATPAARAPAAPAVASPAAPPAPTSTATAKTRPAVDPFEDRQ